MPKFCPNCGKEITDKVKFCPECGADVGSFLKRPDGNTRIDNPGPEVTARKKPDAGNTAKKYAGIILAVVGLGILFLILEAGTGLSASHPSLSNAAVGEAYPASANVTPVIPTQSVQPTGTLSTNSSSASQAMAIAAAIDYLNPTVKNFATSQIRRSSSGTLSGGVINIAQICDVWDAIYRQWTYVSDPPDFNYWTSASDSINNGLKGNCADFAVLNAAVLESIGGTTRVVTVCAPGGSPCHAYAEVLLDSSDIQSIADYITARYSASQIHYHVQTDAQGNKQYWLNLDWQANFPGGPYFPDDGTMQMYYPNGAHQTSTG